MSRGTHASPLVPLFVLAALAQGSVACSHAGATQPASRAEVTQLELEPTTITVTKTTEVQDDPVQLELKATTVIVTDNGWNRRVATAR